MPKPRKPKESALESKCVSWARDRGILVTKNDTRANAGVPDRVFWPPGGRPLVVEFKREGEKPEPLQAGIIAALTRSGYTVVVVASFEGFQECVISMLKVRAKP